MKTRVQLERWDHPIFTVDPAGMEHLAIYVKEPSLRIELSITMPVEDAEVLAKRLLQLVGALREMPR